MNFFFHDINSKYGGYFFKHYFTKGFTAQGIQGEQKII